MQQGFLFEPEAMARNELQDAIARLDFHSALRRMEEFQRVSSRHRRAGFVSIGSSAKTSRSAPMASSSMRESN